jgi:hypothetical protein
LLDETINSIYLFQFSGCMSTMLSKKSGIFASLAVWFAALFVCTPAIAATSASADALFFQSGREARANESGKAMASLVQAVRLADGFFPDQARFATLVGRLDFDQLALKMRKNLPNVQSAKVWHSIQDKDLIPEGITYIPARASTLVSSTYRNELLEIKDGIESRHHYPSLGRILGMALSPNGQTLCGASTNGFLGSPVKRVNEVICLNTKTLEHVKSIVLPDALQINDLVFVGPHRLFVTDSAAGKLWDVNLRSATAKSASAVGSYPSINGIATNGALLYLATRDGVVVRALEGESQVARSAIDKPESGELLRFKSGVRPHSLGAVDGIYAHQGALIAIQNITNPGRIIRIELSRDGRTASRVAVLQSHHASMMDIPTTGVVVGNKFRFLATTQVNRLKQDGQLDLEIVAKNALIAELNL